MANRFVKDNRQDQNSFGIFNFDLNYEKQNIDTVFPQIRPAGIIFLQGLQLRGLLECGDYSRAGIILKKCKP